MASAIGTATSGDRWTIHARATRGAALLGALVVTASVLGSVLARRAEASTMTFRALGDATVLQARARATDGDDAPLRVAVYPEVRSYVSFDVGGLDAPVKRATLRLWVTEPSVSGFQVFSATGASWAESRLTWRSAPRLDLVLGSTGATRRGEWTSVDVTRAVPQDGRVTFALLAAGRDGAGVASSESGALAPALVVEMGSACNGVRIDPGDSIQSAIDGHSPGATFCLTAGEHRLRQRLVPKNDQRFIGERGAVLNGSKVVDNFRKDGGHWVADGQTQEADPSGGVCDPDGYDGCRLPERVYFDDRSLWQVTSLGQLSSGEFYFDHAADEIHLADDPSGHRVEASVSDGAFVTYSADDVVVRGLIVEKFGTPAQSAALGSQGADGWLMAGNTVRNNGGIGICGGEAARVVGNTIYEQGQMGLCGQRNGGLYASNTIHHNNTDGFRVYWEAGGSKFVATKGLVVRGNYLHHNHGFGLWGDGSNVNARFINNRVVRNHGAGIVYEISYGGRIEDNVIRRNGGLTEAAMDGAGILIESSSDVDVIGNSVIGNADGIALKQHVSGSGPHGPWLVENANVRRNTIVMCRGETGAIQTIDNDAIFTTGNNHFEANRYLVGRQRAEWWRWLGGFRTGAQWRGYGHDRDGTFRRVRC